MVRDYGEAARFYVDRWVFNLIEEKRWVVMASQMACETRLLLARAVNDEQRSRIGNRTGGRVFLCLSTDDFWRVRRYVDRGVVFVREPKEESYEMVAVFRDLYGNQ